MFKRGVYFGREGWFPGVSQATVAYRCLKEGIFWEGGVDYGSVAYLGGILEGRDRFWERGI